MSGLGVALVTHALPFAAEMGIPREQAIVMLSLNAICTAVGKPIFGALCDRFGPRQAAWVGSAAQALGWLGLVSASGALAFLSSAGLLCLGLGSMVPCQAGFVAQMWGRAHFGRVSGLVAMTGMLGPLLFAGGIGLAYEAWGSYALPMRSMLVVVLC